MVKGKEENVEVKAEAKTEAKKPQEIKYRTSEFVEAAREQFGVEPFMVQAALKNDKEYTLEQATSIIQKFCRTEVK